MDDDGVQGVENLVEFRRREQGSPDNRAYRGRKHEPTEIPRTPTHGFVPGMQLVCRVIKPEPGGFLVNIVKGDYQAFLPSFGALKADDEVLAIYVGTLDNHILLEERFPQRRKPVEKIEYPFQVIDGGVEDSDDDDEDEGVETVQVSFENKVVSLKFMSRHDDSDDGEDES